MLSNRDDGDYYVPHKDYDGLCRCPTCNTLLLLTVDPDEDCPVYECYGCGWAEDA